MHAKRCQNDTRGRKGAKRVPRETQREPQGAKRAPQGAKGVPNGTNGAPVLADEIHVCADRFYSRDTFRSLAHEEPFIVLLVYSERIRCSPFTIGAMVAPDDARGLYLVNGIAETFCGSRVHDYHAVRIASCSRALNCQ